MCDLVNLFCLTVVLAVEVLHTSVQLFPIPQIARADLSSLIFGVWIKGCSSSPAITDREGGVVDQAVVDQGLLEFTCHH